MADECSEIRRNVAMKILKIEKENGHFPMEEYKMHGMKLRERCEIRCSSFY